MLGLLLGAGFALSSVRAAVAVLALVLSLYLLAAGFEFDTAGRWWPVVVPALMQAPVALTLGLWLPYFNAEESRAAVARGARLYLPAELVDRIAEDPEEAVRSSELVTGTCMVTDIESYTEYAEKLAPKRLEHTLNAYYDTLFEIIDENGGLVTDIVGDSMVAVRRDGAQRAHASTAPQRASRCSTSGLERLCCAPAALCPSETFIFASSAPSSSPENEPCSRFASLSASG